MSTQILYIAVLLVLQVSLNALVVAFTSPASLLRPAVLPLIVICVSQVVPICMVATGKVIWAALLGAHSVTFLVQYIDTAILTKWTAEAGGPSHSQAVETVHNQTSPTTAWGRLRFGYRAAVSTRNLGTPYEVKGVPRFSAEDPSYVPLKAVFLRQKALHLFSCYLVLDILTYVSQPDQNQALYNTARISIATSDNRTIERLIVRSASTLGFWTSLFCIIQAYMGSMAFLSVGLGFSSVESWQPGFGSLSEAYTVRRFWGTFWHKYQQQKMYSLASFITNNLMRIPRDSVASRYTHLFFTFFISGFMHVLSDLAQGLTWEQSGSIRFFCTQAFGIIGEDMIRLLFGQYLSNTKQASNPRVIYKIVGYVWVFIFLVWSTPSWIYPSLYENRGEEKDLVVPYSVLGLIHGALKGSGT